VREGGRCCCTTIFRPRFHPLSPAVRAAAGAGGGISSVGAWTEAKVITFVLDFRCTTYGPSSFYKPVLCHRPQPEKGILFFFF
jgi:hypothetical protein